MTGKVLALRRPAQARPDVRDVDLLASCTLGDAGALAALFDRYWRDVYRFLSRVARANPRDLDDLVQDTFLEIHRSAGKFEGRANVKTWIFGIAANVARHHARGELRRRLFGARHAELPVSPAPGAEDSAIRDEQLRRLAAALSSLSHDLRVAFVLCDVEGMAGTEAARALNVPEGTLFRRLHDARKRLRALLEEASP